MIFPILDTKNGLTTRDYNGPEKLSPNQIFENFNEIGKDIGSKQNPPRLNPIQSIQLSNHQVSSKLKSGQK